MRIMITGGGTGGHTSPAVAIIEELQKRDPRLVALWVGRRQGIEGRICEGMSIPFRHVNVSGWPRRRTPLKAWVALKLGLAVGRCFLYIRKFRPQVVLAVGGYVSLPLGIAAERLGAPVVLHEQNKRLGMANRILAPKAARIFLSYPDTLGEYPHERAAVVGNPVRAGFVHPLSKEIARKQMGLAPGVPVVLVTGGSQGARRLNEAMAEVVGRFAASDVQFLWMTGHSDAPKAREAAQSAAARVEVFSFIEDMPTACAASDLMVCRAGASSTAEIAMMGKPSILVPFPYAADNHQEENARAFEEAGASLLVRDDECTGDRLEAVLRRLLSDPEGLERMGAAASRLARPGASESIAAEILQLVFTERPQAEV
jgi:UDP-N-acetylglucosamine--N-acetylmuramyl-(pentapeptide) pyrophosphoryl-undecaprenol N-acetylglucosamine transferase